MGSDYARRRNNKFSDIFPAWSPVNDGKQHKPTEISAFGSTEKNSTLTHQHKKFVKTPKRSKSAIQKHVKKISQEFMRTQSKYEHSLQPDFQIRSETTDSCFYSSMLKSSNLDGNTKFCTTCSKCETMRDVVPIVTTSPMSNRRKISASNFSHMFSKHSLSRSLNRKISLHYPRHTLTTCNKMRKSSFDISHSPSIRRRVSHSANSMSSPFSKMPFEQIKKAKQFSEKAVLNGKVFSMHGSFPSIREELLKRGWVQKDIQDFPYINPHPQNCVCAHIGWHVHATSVSSISQQVETESIVDNPVDTIPENASVTADNNICSNDSSSEGSLPPSKESQNVEEVDVPAEKLDSQKQESMLGNDQTSVTSIDNNSNTDCSLTINCENSQENNTDELSDDSKNIEIKKLATTLNTKMLGPTEIREGIDKSINLKNLSIFLYTVPKYEKRPLSSKTIVEVEDSEEKIAEEEQSNKVATNSDDFELSHLELKQGKTTHEEPFNPYPELEYIIKSADKSVVARVLRNVEPNFIWTWNRDSVSYKHLSKDQLVNHFPNSYFTTKLEFQYGLCETLQQLHWFSEASSVDTFVPRAYCIGHDDERAAFVHDYRTTVCLNLLKVVVEAAENNRIHDVIHPLGEVPVRRIRQALQHVDQHIQSSCNGDLDSLPLPPLREPEWETILSAHHRIIYQKRKIKSPQHHIETLVKDCQFALQRVKPFWPQLDMDGLRNIWIVKPGAQSRGRGIFLLNNLQEILSLVQSPLIYQTKYVVQKYMERPLLIYKTKFDIRQWFMVTDWNPLTVWMYRECYLRFCSRQYDLSNSDEAIHLSNNAIQIKYMSEKKDENLPDECMWNNYQFEDYLRLNGYGEAFRESVYPGMKNALIATMLAAQVQMESFKHGFEFFGADFMLTEDMKPWLIEINSSPCMAATTSITKRMCAESLSDAIKVVIDYRQNKSADTGKFEMIYKDKDKSIPNPPYLGVDLQVIGRQIWKPSKHDRRKLKKSRTTQRGIKSLPLITLQLEDTGDVRPAKLKNPICTTMPSISAITIDAS